MFRETLFPLLVLGCLFVTTETVESQLFQCGIQRSECCTPSPCNASLGCPAGCYPICNGGLGCYCSCLDKFSHTYSGCSAMPLSGCCNWELRAGRLVCTRYCIQPAQSSSIRGECGCGRNTWCLGDCRRTPFGEVCIGTCVPFFQNQTIQTNVQPAQCSSETFNMTVTAARPREYYGFKISQNDQYVSWSGYGRFGCRIPEGYHIFPKNLVDRITPLGSCGFGQHYARITLVQ